MRNQNCRNYLYTVEAPSLIMLAVGYCDQIDQDWAGPKQESVYWLPLRAYCYSLDNAIVTVCPKVITFRGFHS